MEQQLNAGHDNGAITISATFERPASYGGASQPPAVVSQNFVYAAYDPTNEADYPFTDRMESKYRSAVVALFRNGSITGFEDGTFRPKGELTRAQGSAILARLLNIGESAPASDFSDMKGHWGERFVAFCAGQNIVGGYGDGNFGPDDTLTGYAWGKMIFSALGYDPEALGMTGSNWQDGTYQQIHSHALDRDMSSWYPANAITREEACQIVYNAFLLGRVPRAA